MDKGLQSAYKLFLESPAGVDLVNRLITTEAKYQMEGMKGKTLEEKGLSMAEIGATYAIRTMLQDLSKVTPSEAMRSASSE